MSESALGVGEDAVVAVAFDGVFADMEKFADGEEGEEGGEGAGEGGPPQQPADGGGALLPVGVAGELLLVSGVGATDDGFGLL